MRKKVAWITFFILLISIVEFKLRLGAVLGTTGPFVLMLLSVIGGLLTGGLRVALMMLLLTIAAISFIFLTPFDVSRLKFEQVQQILLFFVEGLIVIYIVHFLKSSKEKEHALREQFQVILSSIGDAVIATDNEGTITYMNARAQMLTGCRYHHAKNRHIQDILKLHGQDRIEEFYSAIHYVLHEGKTRSFHAPIPVQTAKKKIYNLQYTFAPLRNMEGSIKGTVLIFRDVTAHKDMENQREVLLGSISHELKNQLTSIQGYAYILQKKLKNDSESELFTLVEKLNGKIGVMTSMISGMLDLSKIKMGKLDMNIKEFSLNELVATIIHDIEVSSSHEIVVKGSIHSLVKGDTIRIGQVLTNLLSNAVKYSPHNKKIIVTLKQKEMEAHISIQDFGQGISEQKINKIFQPFYRATNEQDSNAIAGTGLGLYISKEIIKQNGGEIWVKSKQGEGSTFYFSLPIAEQPAVVRKPARKNIIERIQHLLKLQYST